MTDFLMALLAATVVGSLIWLILTLLRPLTQRVFSQTWHYYVGLIPAFFLTGAAWIISAGINFISTFIRSNTPVITEPSNAAIGLSYPTFTYNYGSVIEKTGETVAKVKLSIEMFVPIILSIWLIGALVFVVLKISAYIRFRRGISLIGRPLTDPDCKLSVLICSGVATPLLVGVFKPVVVLPEHDYNERERALILLHETAHWRHGDMFIKLFLLFVNALHWFNPLVYRMNKETARLCENACDENLVKNMDKTERVLYGELILSTATYKNAPALCSAMSEGANLKRRLLYMLNGKKMKKPVMILAIIAAFAVVAGGVWLALPINSVAAYDVEEVDRIISYGSGFVRNEDVANQKTQPIVLPDLILAEGIDGTIGYVYQSDLDGEQPNNPDEAVKYMERLEARHEEMKLSGEKYERMIPLYAKDGKTVIGEFGIGGLPPDGMILGSIEDQGGILIDDDVISDETYLWPLADYTRISASFGTRMHPVEKTEVFHDGIDIAAHAGTPILATKSGTVIEVSENDTDGLYVLLEHSAGVQTFYAHMNEYAEGIAAGDTVGRGDVIGYVGSTGASTGSHLHFGVSVDGIFVDPLEGFN